MIRRPPRSTLFPTRRSSDLDEHLRVGRGAEVELRLVRNGRAVAFIELLPAQGHRPARDVRSEEHTSELQSLAYLVCRLLLEKKKQPARARCRSARLAF